METSGRSWLNVTEGRFQNVALFALVTCEPDPNGLGMEIFYVTQLAGRTRISPLCSDWDRKVRAIISTKDNSGALFFFFFFFQNVLLGLYKRCICEVDVNVFILVLHLVHPSDFCSELEPRHVCPIKESLEGGALLVQKGPFSSSFCVK